MGVIKFQLALGTDVSKVISVAYTESTQQELVVTAGAPTTTLNFGGVTTVDMLYLETDQTLILNLDASDGTDITIDPSKPFFISGTSITAAYLSNEGETNANVKFKIWGA